MMTSLADLMPTFGGPPLAPAQDDPAPDPDPNCDDGGSDPTRSTAASDEDPAARRVLIISGPPGAGKGTQGQQLERTAGLLHISTGDIFRDAVKRGTDLGRRAKAFLDRGDFVPDAMAVELVRDRLAQPDAAKGVLLDGFPRTAAQAQQLLAEVDVERLVLLQVPDETCVGRVLDRRIDPQTGTVYHLQHAPPPPEAASRCVRRDADLDEQALQQRLRTYHAHLGQVLPLFRGRIQAVNGARSISEVAADVAEKVATPLAPAPAPELVAGVVVGSTPACSICMDAPADYLVVPCGHQCGCEACLTTVRQTGGGRCPICRGSVDGIVRVYRVGDQAVPVLPPPEPLNVEDDGGWGEDVDEVAPLEGCDLAVSVAPCDEGHVCVTVRAPEGQRQPVDVCCVVDISGSMASLAKYEDPDGNMKDDGLSYLDVVKHATKTVMHMLGDEDRLALVAFDNCAETAFALGEMTAGGRAQAVEALEALHPRGQTNIWDGILAGMDALRAPDRGAPRRKCLLLLTDGQPNLSPPRGHVAELQEYLDSHPGFSFQLNTFGFGNQLDSALLLDLATAGGGTYGFIPDALIVGTAFVNAVANAVTTRAASATLHLTAKNGASFSGLGGELVLGGLRASETSWGLAVSLGPVQYGQPRDVVVPMALPAEAGTYLDAVVVVPDGRGGEQRAVGAGASRAASGAAEAARLRAEAATTVLQAVRDAEGQRGQAANRAVATLAGRLAAAAFAHEAEQPAAALEKLHEDVAGRITKALSTKERFNRWGKHYLRALARSHQLQLNTNFMDPGLQVYGGSVFRRVKDEGGAVFLSLPPPKPARPTVAPVQRSVAATARAGVPLMTTYYAGSGGGCFGGDSTVETRQGALAVRDVRAGDELLLADGTWARVRCTVTLDRPGPLVPLGDRLWITPRHPVHVGGAWRRPCDLAAAAPHPEGVVHTFVLERGHTLLVGGVACATWGHGLSDPGVAHDFYGTGRVLREVAALPGWDEGAVHVRGALRDARGVTAFLAAPLLVEA